MAEVMFLSETRDPKVFKYYFKLPGMVWFSVCIKFPYFLNFSYFSFISPLENSKKMVDGVGNF